MFRYLVYPTFEILDRRFAAWRMTGDLRGPSADSIAEAPVDSPSLVANSPNKTIISIIYASQGGWSKAEAEACFETISTAAFGKSMPQAPSIVNFCAKAQHSECDKEAQHSKYDKEAQHSEYDKEAQHSEYDKEAQHGKGAWTQNGERVQNLEYHTVKGFDEDFGIELLQFNQDKLLILASLHEKFPGMDYLIAPQMFVPKNVKDLVYGYAEEPTSHEVILVLPTYENGSFPQKSAAFFGELEESVHDFRVPQDIFKHLSVYLMGIGSRLFSGKSKKSMNKVQSVAKVSSGIEDLLSVSKLVSDGSDGATMMNANELQNDQTHSNSADMVEATAKLTLKESKSAEHISSDDCGEDDPDETKDVFCLAARRAKKWLASCGATFPLEPLYFCVDTEEATRITDWRLQLSKEIMRTTESTSFDLSLMRQNESLNALAKMRRNKLERGSKEIKDSDSESVTTPGQPISSQPRDMLSSKQKTRLQKQHYSLIGEHSAVKICRWTKAQMRGRGGCYKHCFYGINSHQCMEVTPSLACANKCVFCWRHHSNPVATSWQYKTDPPHFIVDESIRAHKKLLAPMKGVQGVTPKTFVESQDVQHCALSLVGEPIMYPLINDLLDYLHSKRISSFLVTNSQFPEPLKTLTKTTQLYLSIDAADEASLKAVDRPLFRDFWTRFLECIDWLPKSKQRTVFRLTLVKEYNLTDARGYAELVRRGLPNFIEIKAATFCGTSESYTLTMANVPWHEEVVKFGEALCEELQNENYEIACEHRHSCCILIAHSSFKKEGKWQTWIDYPKFYDLVADPGKRAAMTPHDYAAETPSWAVYGAEERGFDPSQERIYGKGKYKREAQKALNLASAQEASAIAK